MLVLVLLGALTKSAQFPFHFWLPHAMAAPTPVSAYLHSATMVKAGVFLLARLWPVLSGTEAWFWIVGGAGVATLLLGAYAAMFQNDLKGLLAYSTISHLGLITLLLGLNSPLAAVAAVFHIMNHATFKASLFMAAGIVDHETGTRDIRRLSGLFRAMPITGTLAIVASAAMAGVPLLNGFLSKEMFFAETVYISSLAVGRDSGCRWPPRSPARSPSSTRCASATASSSARRRPLPARAARADALDARADRAAGARLPGGRRRAGAVDRPAARRRRAAGRRWRAARVQPGGLARLQCAAADEPDRDGCRGRRLLGCCAARLAQGRLAGALSRA